MVIRQVVQRWLDDLVNRGRTSCSRLIEGQHPFLSFKRFAFLLLVLSFSCFSPLTNCCWIAQNITHTHTVELCPWQEGNQDQKWWSHGSTNVLISGCLCRLEKCQHCTANLGAVEQRITSAPLSTAAGIQWCALWGGKHWQLWEYHPLYGCFGSKGSFKYIWEMIHFRFAHVVW